jgi:hypothetical protein
LAGSTPARSASAAPDASGVPAVTPTPAPTVNPELAAEIEAAYLHYWDVRAQALFDLDTTHLSEVMGGRHLQVVSDRIEQLRSEGHAIRTDVMHIYEVARASPAEAIVNDNYHDNSVLVDLETQEEIAPPSGEDFKIVFQLQLIDNAWKVIDSGQAD